MSDISRRIANLSPEKRAILEERLLQQAAAASKDRGVTPRTTPGPWPVSFTQQRLWFLDQLQSDFVAYNEPE